MADPLGGPCGCVREQALVEKQLPTATMAS